jgi:sulfate-transporting ATPase
MIAFEGEGRVTFFDGNYQLYEEDKKKRLGDEGPVGPKGKFRKLGSM